MNIMEIMGLVTKFMGNPENAINEVSEQYLIPGWQILEDSNGGEICLIMRRQVTDGGKYIITVSIYKSGTDNKLDFVNSYTLSDLVTLMKNYKNGTATANPLPDLIATHSEDECTGNTEPIGSLAEPTETEQPTGEPTATEQPTS